jgi:hypothetical protein
MRTLGDLTRLGTTTKPTIAIRSDWAVMERALPLTTVRPKTRAASDSSLVVSITSTTS